MILPDERLLEKKISDELGVSRTPVREALNRLAHEQLISFQPHAGYRAASISISSFQSLIELRALVEPEAAALAAVRAIPQEVVDLRRLATLPHDPADDTGFVQFCRANALFHLAIVRCARNPMLENIVMSALDLYQRPAYLRIGRQLDASNPSSKHHAIVDAIEAGNADGAREGMLLHVQGGGTRILEALRAAGYE